MASRMALQSTSDSVLPAQSFGKHRATFSMAPLNRARSQRNVATAPRFDDLREEREPQYRRGFSLSIAIHLIIASRILYSSVEGPPSRVFPNIGGMNVILAGSAPLLRQAINEPRLARRPDFARAPSRKASSDLPKARPTHDQGIPISVGGLLNPEPLPLPLAVTSSTSSKEESDQLVVTPTVRDAPAVSKSLTVAATKSLEEIAWERAVVGRMERSKRRIDKAFQSGGSGAVLLRLVIGRDGQLLAAELARQGGGAIFEQAALSMAANANPFPSPPRSMASDAMRIIIPVLFNCSVSEGNVSSTCGKAQGQSFTGWEAETLTVTGKNDISELTSATAARPDH